MYCEGGRSRTGRIGDVARPGIGRLALESGAPIVPVAIHGSSQVRNWKRLQFPKVTVQYGEPLRYERVEEPTREQQQAVADEILEEIRGLYEDLDAVGRPAALARARAERRAARQADRAPQRRVRREGRGMIRAVRRAIVLAIAVLVVVPVAAHAAPVTLAKVGDFSAPVYVTAPLGDTARVFVVEKGGTIQVLDGAARSTFLDITSKVNSAASAGCSRWPSRSTTPRAACSTSTTRRAARPGRSRSRSTASTRPTPTGRTRPTRARWSPSRTTSRPTTTAASCSSGPTACSTPAPATAGAPTTRAAMGRTRWLRRRRSPAASTTTTASASSCASTRPRAPSRSSPTACATRGASPSTATTGDLIIGDVGQDRYEEVDFAAAPGDGAGANYGWNTYEGLHTYPGNAPAGAAPGTVLPVIEYPHGPACSITGGYVVRDPALPELAGTYLYGDNCTGAISGATLPAGTTRTLGFTVANVSSFGEDGCGRVYAASLGGAVYRFASSGACAGPAPFVGRLPAGAVGPARRARSPRAGAHPAARRRAPARAAHRLRHHPRPLRRAVHRERERSRAHHAPRARRGGGGPAHAHREGDAGGRRAHDAAPEAVERHAPGDQAVAGAGRPAGHGAHRRPRGGWGGQRAHRDAAGADRASRLR